MWYIPVPGMEEMTTDNGMEEMANGNGLEAITMTLKLPSLYFFFVL